ncbi:MAG: hypothetical protein DWQ01_00460 [Planctomycetota bacterium]|nr:MAG: hypothetical protein DWQ01_00460 [Planctomycetota bacterium]
MVRNFFDLMESWLGISLAFPSQERGIPMQMAFPIYLSVPFLLVEAVFQMLVLLIYIREAMAVC